MNYAIEILENSRKNLLKAAKLNRRVLNKRSLDEHMKKYNRQLLKDQEKCLSEIDEALEVINHPGIVRLREFYNNSKTIQS